MDEKRKELLGIICKMLGYDPVGMGDLLNILTHPDVIDQTWAYLESVYEEISDD